jgi:hypothetical protein
MTILARTRQSRLGSCFGLNPVVEPVAWMVYTEDGKSVYVTDNPTDIQQGQRALPLYTKLEWQGLTKADVNKLTRFVIAFKSEVVEFIRAAEAKLKEKND